jgi:hypothetical protein
MSQINGKICEIDILRDKLEGLINEKQGNLLDSEVVSASKELNRRHFEKITSQYVSRYYFIWLIKI